MSTLSSEIAENFSKKLVFFVNGKKIEDCSVDPEWTLLYYLRCKLQLYGTKNGCDEGGCGSCTVMVSRYDRQNHREVHYPINSCITPICSLHGLAVTTVEGIGSTYSQLHPVQERIAKAYGTQCGFCTPGMVMSMYTLLRQNSKPKLKNVADSLQGNLCRCTGYRSIIAGFKTFTEESNRSYKMDDSAAGECSKLQKKSSSQRQSTDERLFNIKEFLPYDPSQEPIFPPELKLIDKYDKEYLKIKGPRTTWLRPTTLNQLLGIKYKNPEAKIVAGNTIIIFECKFGNQSFPIMAHSEGISEMTEISVTTEGVRIGATANQENIQIFLEKLEKKYSEVETRLFRSIRSIINRMASKQIRCVASIGGNIMASTSTCDLLPILIATRAKIEIHHKKYGIKLITFDSNFIVGPRKNVLRQDEVLVAVHLPFSNKNQYFQVYKQAKRRDVAQSIANLAVKVEFKDKTNKIASIFFGIGGVVVKPIEAHITEKKLKGLRWTKSILEQAFKSLLADIGDNVVTSDELTRYRESLVLSLFLRAFMVISEELRANLGNRTKIIIDKNEFSGIKTLGSSDYKSSLYFNEPPGIVDAIQRPMVQMSGFKQATGEAVYIDDIPEYRNELFIAYIFSKKAHAKILSIDASEALKTKGVRAFLSENDIPPEKNRIGRFFEGDEQIFYSKKVTSEGQIIGAILAEDRHIAQRAIKLVKVKYEPIVPLIITIEDAIEHDSFFHDFTIKMCHGNVDEILKNASHSIKSSCRIGNQKHYYLEVQSCLVVPQGDDDSMDIYSSTQCPTDVANVAANLLGVYRNKIKVHVKRVGGAFGGKEWKSIVIAAPAILAAQKFRRPVRCVLERNQDIVVSGGRTSYLFNYTVGFDKRGKILACDFDIYLNCGYSLEINHIALRKTLDHLDNAFNIQAIRAKGRLCKTNIASTTTIRGFGAPEAQFPASCIIEEIAEFLNKDTAEISQFNLYKPGDISIYGQIMENCTVKKCWEECVKRSKYWEKRKDVENYNSQNIYKKRGLSIVPTKFGTGMPYLPPPLLQAGALLNVYSDGSVLLSYGGVEHGQGLDTKMIQVAARVLEIPAEIIHIDEAATNVVPNSAPTVSDISSDIFGEAVVGACRKLMEILHPYKAANPKGTWNEVVSMAHWDKVSLSATGFFKYKPKGWNAETGTGNLFNSFVCGAACSEVEIDVLTGDHQVLRSDIVLDLGESLNPAIDIGQVAGAFMQGYGLFVMEETLYSNQGSLLSNSLARYKIPTIGDIPSEFNISFLKISPNSRPIYSPKAVGEPPLILASSIYFAIKDAIKAARKDNDMSTIFYLECPAGAEKIRMRCEDPIVKLQLDGYIPGQDYPIYNEVPQGLTFRCDQKPPGYYSDPEAQCQVWHWCLPNGQKFSFLCPNGTIFNQFARVCDWWFNVDCAATPNYYGINEDLYRIPPPYNQPGQSL